MVVLDTDHVSLLENPDSVHAQRIRTRMAELGPGEAAATIISFEEQTRGWLSYLARAQTVAQQVDTSAKCPA